MMGILGKSASRVSHGGSVSGMSSLDETQRCMQNMLQGYCLPSSPGISEELEEGAGERMVWASLLALLPTRPGTKKKGPDHVNLGQ